MIPYIVNEGLISSTEVDLAHRIRRIIQTIPEISDELGYWVSCHMMVRALRKFFPELSVVDGYYYPNYEHSWLVTPAGNILDVYPVAVATGPILIASAGPARFLYRRKRLHPFFSEPWFRKGVCVLVQAIGETIKDQEDQ